MSEKKMTLSRRSFLKVSAATGAVAMSAGTLSGCGLTNADKKTFIGSNEDGVTVVPTAGHNNCGGRCVIKAHVKGGSVLKLSTDAEKATPGFPQLHACTRGRAYRKTFLSPDRLKYPMKRVGTRGEGKFEQISWDEATTIIADKLIEMKEKHGPASRYIHYACGYEQQSMSPLGMAKRLLALDGGFLEYYNSYSAGCMSIALPYVYGTSGTANTTNDYENAKYIILLGNNPSETDMGRRTTLRLKQAREAGAKIISVDPRLSDSTVALADEWIPVKPTTDGALIDAMAYVIVSEGLHDQAFINKFAVGFDENSMPEGVDPKESYKSYLLGGQDGVEKTPEWAEKICGVPANKIRQIAREYATIKPAAILQGWGPQRHANGEQITRGGAILPIITGNLGKPGTNCGGGGIPKYPKASAPTLPPAVPNPFPGKIPVFLWTDAITRGTEMGAADRIRDIEVLPSNIKCILNLAGNTLINQHSDCNRTAELLKDESKVEFILCSDIFMTPSAKFADILLPGTSMFEEDNMGGSMRGGSYIVRTNKCIEPLFESRFDYDWMCEVADKMGIGPAFHEKKTALEWLQYGYAGLQETNPEFPGFEEFSQSGVHKSKFDQPIIAFKAQIEDFANNPFPTPSGKIELFSSKLLEFNDPENIPALPKYVPAFEGPEDELTEKYPLQLMSWHIKRRCHSVHDNNPWLEEVSPQTMWMHPIDAQARGLTDGQKVEVFNDRGTVHIPVTITERIVPGVVAIPQGAWYAPDTNGVDQRGCINTLTTWRATPLAKANPQHTNLVEVKAL